MDEESLQTALLSGADVGNVEATGEVPNLPRSISDEASQKPQAARRNLSPQSKLRRLLHAFHIMCTPYFRESTEGKCLFGLLFVIVLISCGGKVYLSYQVNYFYSALADKDAQRFWEVILAFVIAMVCFVPVGAAYNFVQIRLQIAWRKWLTERVLKLYFHNKVYYALERKTGGTANVDYYDAAVNKKAKVVDNPDQRIQEDINTFTNYSLVFFSIAVESTVDLISFSIILGSIMPELFIGLVAFAFLGTLFTILIGKKLVKLNFEMLQREADFRFSLVRIRENAESIAFYSGECVEEKETDRRLIRVIANATMINMAQLRLSFFTISYNRLTWILPIMMVAPEYFAGIVELGVVQQARVAFDHILGDLSIIISEFLSIANFSAGIERLFSFLNVMQQLDRERDVGKEMLLRDPSRYEKKPDKTISETISSESSASPTTRIFVKDIELPTTASFGTRINILTISDLKLVTPDNKRVLAENLNLTLGEDKSLLIVGVSGAGKSSLLRAIAGLWTTGDGVITRPRTEDICFLPQRPYCPPGTLRDQLLYPSMVNSDSEFDPTCQSAQWSDQDLLTVLVQVDLPDLASRSGDGDPLKGLSTKLE
ncbi:hypothetical protein ACHAXN_007335 [Cyclotella atomus]